MEPNNTIQNENNNTGASRPLRAPGFANGGAAGGGATGNETSDAPIDHGGDVVFQDEPKKKSHTMSIGMILLAVLAAGGIGFGVWAMLDGNSRVQKKDDEIKSLNSQISNLNTQMEEKDQVITGDDGVDISENVALSDRKVCEGKYYGEMVEENNGITLDLKYTYVLNGDGTFTADFGGVSGKNGTYAINDNTISLTGNRELVGPRDQVPSYVTEDAIIADDCSSIKLNYNGSYVFELLKQ